MDPQAEYERVSAKYAPAGWRDAVWAVAVLVLLLVVDRFVNVHWSFLAGTVAWFVVAEVRNYRLRKRARDFAESAATR
jgi:hypothetical protein